MPPTPEPAPTSVPIGRTGRLSAEVLAGPDGDHALIVREAGTARALVFAEQPPGAAERLVLSPVDDDLDVRVDGDALAVWLGSRSLLPDDRPMEAPAWATGLGTVLVLLLVVFAVVGGAAVFSWLAGWVTG